MTIKELYNEAKKNGWENLPVKVLRPGEKDCYGNYKSLSTIKDGELVHRDKDFWEGVPYEFLAVL